MSSIGRLRPTRGMTAAAVALIAVIAVLVAGFWGGRSDDSAQVAPARAPMTGASDSSSSSVAGSASAESGVALDEGTSVDRAASPSSGKAAATAGSPGTSPSAGVAGGLPGAQRVRTADLSVQVSDVRAAAARVRATAVRLGGSVASEDSRSAADGGYAQADLVVRVPEPKLEEAVDAVASTGKELTRTSGSQDVTAVLADLESREASQRASVERVRALMAKATSLSDVVLLESELSRREGDLEAAQASRRAMSDRAAQATLSVTLSTQVGPAAEPNQQNAFMAGLQRSWDTVLASTTVLLTVLGALLPIAVLLLIIGGPAYLLTRRNRRAKLAGTNVVSPQANSGDSTAGTGSDAGKTPAGSVT